MLKPIAHLTADASFSARAAALASIVPEGKPRLLDDVFEPLQRFTSVRRREVRLARLEEAERAGIAEWRAHRGRVPDAVAAFCTGLAALSEHATSLQSLITPRLDDVIALAADGDHPLHTSLHDIALSTGFTASELKWLFDELKLIEFRPVALLCDVGFEDFVALLDGVSSGENGLLMAGFVRFTGDPETDARIEKLVIRLRRSGVTASVFLGLVIVIAAHVVASHHRSGS